MRFTGPKGIEGFVARFLESRAATLRGQRVVDVPAGDGRSTAVLQRIGARPEPLDLFPEFFKVPGLTCRKADLSGRLPVEDGGADVVLCQEGIEHVSDQRGVFEEFARVLKPGGTLLVTCPNYSSLRSRWSYLLAETEKYYHYMPPNEADSIWTPPGGGGDVYLGHVFLIGVQRLRLLARLAGFRIKQVHHLRASKASVLLLLLLYPLIAASNLLAYWKSLRKAGADRDARRAVYREQLALGLDPRILVDCHLFVEFELDPASRPGAGPVTAQPPSSSR